MQINYWFLVLLHIILCCHETTGERVAVTARHACHGKRNLSNSAYKKCYIINLIEISYMLGTLKKSRVIINLPMPYYKGLTMEGDQ